MMSVRHIVAAIELLTPGETDELRTHLLDRWGIYAELAPVPTFFPTGLNFEQLDFSLKLVDPGPQKIAVLVEVRRFLHLGLKEAREVVMSAPTVLTEGLSREEAEEIRGRLVKAGATVEVF